VLVIVDAIFIGLCESNILTPGVLRTNYWGLANAANVLGLTFSFYLMQRGLAQPNKELEPQMRCLTIDNPKPVEPGPKAIHFFKQRPKSTHFYQGVEFNPRWRALPLFDLKMFLYVIGAVMLHLLVLDSCLARYYELGSRPSDLFASNDSRFNTAINTDSSTVGDDTTGSDTLSVRLSFNFNLHFNFPPEGGRAASVYTLLMTFFVYEYLWFEEMHLFTHDLFAERLAFKLCWGCMVYYPFFYCIGLWSVTAGTRGDDATGGDDSDASSAATVPDITTVQAWATIALFFSGWLLSRGANLQKYHFKRDPKLKTFCFLPWWIPSPIRNLLRVEQLAVPHSKDRLLLSGWWGLARHVNYCGEILQAIALALPGVLVSSMLFLLYVVFLRLCRVVSPSHALCPLFLSQPLPPPPPLPFA
jgi:delta14-sterol reductase